MHVIHTSVLVSRFNVSSRPIAGIALHICLPPFLLLFFFYFFLFPSHMRCPRFLVPPNTTRAFPERPPRAATFYSDEFSGRTNLIVRIKRESVHTSSLISRSLRNRSRTTAGTKLERARLLFPVPYLHVPFFSFSSRDPRE